MTWHWHTGWEWLHMTEMHSTLRSEHWMLSDCRENNQRAVLLPPFEMFLCLVNSACCSDLCVRWKTFVETGRNYASSLIFALRQQHLDFDSKASTAKEEMLKLPSAGSGREILYSPTCQDSPRKGLLGWMCSPTDLIDLPRYTNIIHQNEVVL